jgi:glycine/D-amino acid oxidase-like deaminating enzyme
MSIDLLRCGRWPVRWTPRIWAQNPPSLFSEPLTGSHHCSLVVVGGGLTGLSAAFHFQQRRSGATTLLLEAVQIGSGASGRAGGILVNHPAVPGSREDTDFLYRMIRELDLDSGLRYPETSLSIARREYANPLLNPLRLTRSLAQRCLERGIPLHESSPVERIANDGGLAVFGRDYQVHCDFVVLAVDAYAHAFGLFSEDLQVTAETCVAVQLPDSAPSPILWNYYQETGDARKYVWGRRLEKNSFLFGGGEETVTDLDEVEPSPDPEALRKLSRLLPELASAKPLSLWSGLISGFSDGGSRLRQTVDPRIWFVGGYEGYGLAAAVRAGAQMAKLLTG